MAEKIAQPNTPSDAQAAQRKAVDLCRDLAEGTFRMREKASTYLRQNPMESDKAYRNRVESATLYNGFARTVEGLTGMALRENPKLGEDVPSLIAGDRKKNGKGGHWESIDAAGTHGDVFAAERLADALTDGHVGIFVDYPPVNRAVVVTKADEDRLAVRPYWVPVKKQDIVRWRVDRVGGKQMLTRFAHLETITEDDGKYGEKQVEQVREYVLLGVEGEKPQVGYRIHRKVEGKDEWTSREGIMATITEIPLAIAYAKKTGTLQSKPPLEDLAHENVRHFQLRSDRDNTLHICGVPILHASGLTPEGPLVIAPDSGVQTPKDAKLEYVEPAGSALDSTRDELKDTEDRMAAQGLAMLKRTETDKTATEERIQKGEHDSALARVVRSLQDAIEEALRFHAMWLGLDDGGSVTLTRNFAALSLSAQDVAELRNLVADDMLSLDTLWDRLEQGGWVDEGFDRVAELERIKKAKADRPPVMPFGMRPPAPKPIGDSLPPKPIIPEGAAA